MAVPSALAILIEDLRNWRETELAAEQDVEDAEHHANRARSELKRVQAEVKAAADAIDHLLVEYTAPLQIVFVPEGDE